LNDLVCIELNIASTAKDLENAQRTEENMAMGFLSNSLLKGAKNKCIDSYLRDVPERYLAAVRSGFPAAPKTILNIHIEMAPKYFHELDVFLRSKGTYSPSEIDGHFLHAESIALATACKQLNLDYEQTETVLSDKAYELAESLYDESLSPEQNFSRVQSGRDLNAKSVMYRNWVLIAFRYLSQQE
jgi:hypothetical protein